MHRHLTHSFLDSVESASRTASRSVHPFLYGSPSCEADRQTHTDPETCSTVANGRVYAMPAMRADKNDCMSLLLSENFSDHTIFNEQPTNKTFRKQETGKISIYIANTAVTNIMHRPLGLSAAIGVQNRKSLTFLHMTHHLLLSVCLFPVLGGALFVKNGENCCVWLKVVVNHLQACSV